MNYEQLKAARFQNGFQIRLKQLSIKAASREAMEKEAMGAALGRGLRGIGQAAGKLFGGGARGIGQQWLPGMRPQPTFMRGVQGVENWLGRNPSVLPATLGVAGGMGLSQGANSYVDYRRRQALQNLGLLQRLGLALQLATNPQGFSNTLRL